MFAQGRPSRAFAITIFVGLACVLAARWFDFDWSSEAPQERVSLGSDAVISPAPKRQLNSPSDGARNTPDMPPRPRLPRSDRYAAALGGSALYPALITRAEIVDLWVIGADSEDLHAAISALWRIADANETGSAKEELATGFADDLMALVERRRASSDAGASDDQAAPAEMAGRRLAELSDTLRYGTDEETEGALREIARYRLDEATDAMLRLLDHPSSSTRRRSIEALWRSAADGARGSEPDALLDGLDRASYDANDEVAQLASLALFDLSRLDAEPEAESVLSDQFEAAQAPPSAAYLD